MKLFLEKENRTEEIPLTEPTTIAGFLKQRNIPLESVILVKNDEICLEEEELTDKDELKLLSVISGG